MSVVDVWPVGSMSLLTQYEADSLSLSSQGELYDLYRNCSLAVLNSGNITDNSKELLDNFKSFEINIIRNERGLKLELINPPKSSLVEGQVIKKLRKHLYAVLRDIVQIHLFSEFYNDSLKRNIRLSLITSLILYLSFKKCQCLKGWDETKPRCMLGWSLNLTRRI